MAKTINVCFIWYLTVKYCVGWKEEICAGKTYYTVYNDLGWIVIRTANKTIALRVLRNGSCN